MKFNTHIHEGISIKCEGCERHICDGDTCYLGDDDKIYCTMCHMDHDMDKKETAMAFARYCSGNTVRKSIEGKYFWFDENGYCITEEKMFINFLKSI